MRSRFRPGDRVKVKPEVKGTDDRLDTIALGTVGSVHGDILHVWFDDNCFREVMHHEIEHASPHQA